MIEERFISLLTKKLTDEISSAEVAELKAIAANDEASQQQYNFFINYWKRDQEQYSNSELMFQRIKGKITVDEEPLLVQAPPARGPRYFLNYGTGLAAALLIGICFTMYYNHPWRKPVVTETLLTTQTPSRSKSKITLSDGTVVTLNSETSLKYPASFEGPNREVYLSGEAFFNVTKDHSHPFIVHAGKMSIRVLGTAFNVKSYKNDPQSETTLIRGAIEVTLSDRPSDRIILKPHDKLILKSTTFKIPKQATHLKAALHDSVNTSYALTNLTYLKVNDTTVVETSWVNNKLIFKDEAFEAIANQMERWYGIKVKFKNPAVKEFRFTGVFEKENITQALDALKMIESFDYKYKNDTIYIF